jgi:hypothetical protein
MVSECSFKGQLENFWPGCFTLESFSVPQDPSDLSDDAIFSRIGKTPALLLNLMTSMRFLSDMAALMLSLGQKNGWEAGRDGSKSNTPWYNLEILVCREMKRPRI